ncbi:hypothetical protein ABID59_001952 [Bradyrhizobium sp. S3.3.6]|uniref:hypothetical protein n=1 Tax=Bradyrhizobium sp. S3.3.6 TaxID=3156429 RepID=UPI0033932EEB
MTVHAGVDVILECRVFLSFEETHRTGLVATHLFFLDYFRMSRRLALKAERSWRILPAVLRFGSDCKADKKYRSAYQCSNHGAPDLSQRSQLA